MDITAQVAADAISRFEREMRAIGAKRIPQAVDRAIQAVNREAVRMVQAGLKQRLDVPEPKTLRAIVGIKPLTFRDEVTGRVRVADVLGRARPAWAARIRIASALTKPVITDCDTKRISRPSFSSPATIWKTPIRMVAANRYSTPCSFTSRVMTTAVAAVAAEIIAGRPPTTEITIAMTTEA